MAEEREPRWRRDFDIDIPEADHIARVDFVKLLALTSAALAAGQGWLAIKSLVRRQHGARAWPAHYIASLADMAPGTTRAFRDPDDEPCLLVRTRAGELVAYRQACTHLSCMVVPDIERGLLRCPCHEGYFELRSGRNLAGPPPRPLPRILLALRGDAIYATGVEPRAR